MPSPIGHAIAGVAIGRALTPGNARLLAACAATAMASDLDLVVPGAHRMATHSVGAIALVTILAIAVTGWVTGAWPRATQDSWHRARQLTIAVVAAYASHMLLDWLAADPRPPHGIQVLWPLSDGWFISGLDLFRGTARQQLFTARSMWINATAIAQEVAILGPLTWIVFRLRR